MLSHGGVCVRCGAPARRPPAGRRAQARPHGRELGAPGQGDLGTSSWRSGDRQTVRAGRAGPLQAADVRGCDEPFARRGPAAAWTARGPGAAARAARGRRPGAATAARGPRAARPGRRVARRLGSAGRTVDLIDASSPELQYRRAPVRRRPAPFPRSPERPLWIAPAAEKSARRHSVSCCPQCLLSGRRPRLTCPLRPQTRLALVVGVAPSRPQGVCRRRLRTLTGHRQPPCDRYGAAAGAAERRATAQRPSES